MIRTRTPRADASASAASEVLAKGPRLSAARQRRLDQLLDKNRESALSTDEATELESMLDEVDRKSFWKVARAG
ncbi:MAG TPA: hypothetical protein VG269_02150 [Tepidisphaeraceae bacterium]|jgi:hypothetical protein|nr:hypothetical protein [Tepidisphaeraceae bacterium]